ncbi:cytochrome P450 [Mycena rosella]|uniref:Cytochrome P450 n=1 Tax=Mycena rosella TaxID=1033263 RepID=A0AAD7DCV4_MYCRO|nr:cytochrome P450 [Mycena rosella]
MPSIYHLGAPGALLLLALWGGTKLVAYAQRGPRSTKLNGPPSTSRILGLSRELVQTSDMSAVYEEWAARYGPRTRSLWPSGPRRLSSQIPSSFYLPQALAHFYQSERSVYVKTENDRLFIDKIFGRGIVWAEGDVHKRQRKALTPAFSNAAIRRLTSVFYDSTYKLKTLWDTMLETTDDGGIIEVQECLDSIGIAGFSHDFHYLDGQNSAVTAAFKALQIAETSFLSKLMFILSLTFPFLMNIPTPRMRLFWELRRSLNVIAERLYANTRSEKDGDVAEELTDQSVMKAEVSDAEVYMTQEEVVAQVWPRILKLYGTTDAIYRWYEPTLYFDGVDLTGAFRMFSCWLIQDELRKELAQFGSGDPTWDQLVSELPFLDAVVLEVLRVHPPIPETLREAIQDDIIPLGTPVVTPSGEVISSIAVAKGSAVLAPIRCINRSEALWGPDAKEFKPERWVEVKKEMKLPAKELQGHHHLLTFHDGPRTCLGKSFALAASAALSVLVRNFVFEFPDGPETQLETHMAIVPRPKVVGQTGAKVPLRVRRAE